MSIYNPFMPATSFSARAAFGGGGGDGDSGGGGGGAPNTISVPSQDKNDALRVAEAASQQHGVEYARAYNPNTGEISVVQVGPQGSDRQEPVARPAVPSTPIAQAPTPEPTPVQPAPAAPVTPATTPVATPAAPVAPPDPIPQSSLEDAIVMEVSKPTYTGPAAQAGTPSTAQAVPSSQDTGTFSTPLQTANLSAVPDQIMVRPNYTGTTMANLTMPSQGQQNIGNVMYGNDLGQTMLVTEVNGQPTTYVPPGYTRMSERPQAVPGSLTPQAQTQADPRPVSTLPQGIAALGAGLTLGSGLMGFSEGGSVEERRGVDAMYSMATKFLGYRGPKTRKGLEEFAKSSPGAATKMKAYLSGMAKGGLVSQSVVKGYQAGGMVGAGGTIADPEFFNSSEYQNFQNTKPMVGTMDMYNSPFFGQMGSGTFGKLQDQAYIDYLKRTNPNSPLIPQEGPQLSTPTNMPMFPGMGLIQQPALGQISENQLSEMSGNLMRQTLQPTQATTAFIRPEAADFIAPTAGQTVPQAPFAETATVGTVQQADMPQYMTPAQFTSATAAQQIADETARLQAAQGQVSTQAQVQAAQQQDTSLAGMQAAQANAIMLQNPMQREIQDGELISGSAVDAAKVEALNSQMQAAQATPSDKATVQGQLEGLMSQFEGGQTPAWAAGAMRNAMAQLSARGLGASSLAGQAVIQAAMESALPIAMADAQTRAQFEAQNLSNRQQTAMMAAQQRAAFLQMDFDQGFQSRVMNAARIADIANMNFTTEQQIALENSRMANTTNLQNLNNRQAMVMAEAAALANMDMSNLNNRQQAAVQNAQNFLQMDLTNLNNEQQTGLFKSQQNIQALFTDQAAENAALQFNAASENQTKQFFSNLGAQVSQFNATQQNAMDQFNVNSVNAMRQFNSEVQQQRDLFNAQNGLVIAQANAQWRQNIATLNTAAQNQSNMDFARTINALTSTNLDQIWQRERDIMSYAFTQSETAQDRALNILLADKNIEEFRKKMASDERNAMFTVGAKLLFGI